MKTSIRISLFSLGAAFIGFWPAGANAQTDPLARCALGSPGTIFRPAPGGPGARAAMIQRTLKCLQGATGQAPAAGSAGVGGQFVTFDPPGSTSTTPQGITPMGRSQAFTTTPAACSTASSVTAMAALRLSIRRTAPAV